MVRLNKMGHNVSRLMLLGFEPVGCALRAVFFDAANDL
jgi:hypothetical protein